MTVSGFPRQDKYIKQRFPAPEFVIIKKRKLNGSIVRWVAQDSKGNIIAQKPIAKGESLTEVRQQFNKKTYSFDKNITSVQASTLKSAVRGRSRGKFTVKRVTRQKIEGKRYQIQVNAAVAVYPLEAMSKPRTVDSISGFSGFNGSDAKKIEAAHNHIISKLWKDGIIKKSSDTVVFGDEKVYYQYYSMEKNRPIGADPF